MQLVRFPNLIPIMFCENEVFLPESQVIFPIEGIHSLSLVADSVKTGNFIGIVQAKNSGDFFRSGTLGKIVDFKEIDHEKVCLGIEGVAGFDIISYEKAECNNIYIKGYVSYARYKNKKKLDKKYFDREKLRATLAKYFEKVNMDPNWDIINQCSDADLIEYLSNFCPFDPIEKQCLLEASSLTEQSRILTQIMELSIGVEISTPTQLN